MNEHSQRQHAEWAASASARNAVCAGAIAMCSMVEERESEPAAWGTACHQLAHEHFDAGEVPKQRHGQSIRIEHFEFEIDDEMADVTDGWLTRCHEQIAAEECLFWVEENLPLDKLSPPLPSGGTGDLVIYRPQTRLLIIRDLKTGRGVFVDARGSWQMRTYALGALLAHPNLDVEWVETVIDQPRLERGDDGGVRSERFHVADLYEWAGDMLAAMRRAAAAKAEFAEIAGNRVKFDEWAEKWLATGQCTFCDAKPLCPQFRKEALATLPKIATDWHENPSDVRPPELSNAAMLLSTAELTHALNGVEMLKDWINAVTDRAHNEAERGVRLEGWKLVDKIGHRAWKSENQAEVELAKLGLTLDKLYVRKIVSPAAADKLLGKRKTLIVDLWEKPIRGKNLVRADRSDRPEAQTSAQTHHEAVE